MFSPFCSGLSFYYNESGAFTLWDGVALWGGQLGAGSNLCIKNEHVALFVKSYSCFTSNDVILMTFCIWSYLGFIYASVKSNVL